MATKYRGRSLALIPPAIALVRKRRPLGLPLPLSAGVAWSVPLLAARGLPSGRLRSAVMWGAQMWAYKASFEMPYDNPARLRERLHVDYPIALDCRLGGGVPPSERLQRRLRHPPKLNALDRALTLFYLTWEIEPHAVLGWILRHHPQHFARAALTLAATYDATLIGYFALPTAPPWWASEYEGRMGRAVRRVNAEVIRELKRQPRPGIAHNPGANPWASMPSDHFGTATATAMLLWRFDRRAGAAGWAYALTLGFALVYLGEHYLCDLLAGLGLATAIHAAAARLSDPAGAVVERVSGQPRRRSGRRLLRRARR